MSDDSGQRVCDDVRALLERRLDEGASVLGADEESRVAQHLSVCAPCESWRRQNADIVAMSRAVPQFDVPEALTQQILSAVAEERGCRAYALHDFVLALATASVVVLLVLESVDNLAGLGSWCVSLTAMYLIKLLVSDQQQRRPLAQ